MESIRKEQDMKKPRCGAKTRRGTPCQASAIWSAKSKRYTRCKNHGGCSTGPRTAEGIERCRRPIGSTAGTHKRPIRHISMPVRGVAASVQSLLRREQKWMFKAELDCLCRACGATEARRLATFGI